MKLFRIFKKKTRRLGHGPIPTASDVSTAVGVPASDVPASDVPASDVPAAGGTPDTSSAGGVPTASNVPTASSTPTSSHPIGPEILAQGVDPITAE